MPLNPLVLGGIGVVIIVVVAVIIYFATQGGGGSPPSGGSPGPAPGPSGPKDPRQSVWSSGQSLLSSVTDAFTLKGKTFTTAPTGVPNTTALITATPTVSYTFSMDVYLAAGRPDNGANLLWYHNSAAANANPGRTPCLWILSNNWAAGYKGCPHAAHVCQDGHTEGWMAAPPNQSTPPVPDGVWTNITVTGSGSTMNMYINGNTTPIATSTPASPLAWQVEATPTSAWKWDCGAVSAADQVKFANFYWWNSVLTTSQIAQLAVPSAPTPGVATTSYYLPEPYDDAKETAGY